MLFGAHESIAGGVSRAFARAEEHTAKSLQIFTKTARGWTAPPLTTDERKLFRAEARRSGLPSVAHGSYLANLGTEDPLIRQRSLDCLTEELQRCEWLGVPWLVIHPGAHPDERRGLEQIVAGLDELRRRTRGFTAKICLEATAGQGNCIGWRFEHLEEILQRVEFPRSLGFCLDTCHLFAAGYDISTDRGYDRVMAEFDRRVGTDRIQRFHLNDSKKPLGCRVDRHEEVGKGCLGLGPFKRLANDRRFKGTIGVLETPFAERYAESIRLLESLVHH